MAQYEIQTFTICDEWINTWTIEENGKSIPEIFDSKEEAQAALNDFLSETKDMEYPYDPEEFRIVELKARNEI